MLNNLAIIQARTGSKRFPNKMFAKINGKHLIEWVIKRLKRAKKIEKIVLATTSKKKDKELVKISKKNKIAYYCGDEKNVLKRFYFAAKKAKSKRIIRICADNPFIDPAQIDSLIKNFKNNHDYSFNHRSYKKINFADGFGAEIFTVKILEKIYKIAKKVDHKEHVTKIIWESNSRFKILNQKNNPKLSFPYLKYDVNTKSDLKNLNLLVKKNKIKISTTGKMIIKKDLSNQFDILLKKLFPIHRSLISKGNLFTINEIKKIVPLKIINIKSNKRVYDWKIPKEWIVKEAWLKDPLGEKIADFQRNNLSVVQYSKSFAGKMKFNSLKKRLFLHTLPNEIPYVTSYYNDDWGFCVSKTIFNKIKKYKKSFEVKIDSKFKKSNLKIGEILVPGKSKKEILISTYICHPSMANDNLSGIILTSFLYKYIKSLRNRYWSYRIVFLPETIGSISYCKLREKILKKISFGLAVSCVGGKGKFSYKESFNNNHFLNSLIKENFKELGIIAKKYPFNIHGSDERQYSSHNFKINMCSIFKDKYHEYKEYHSSGDNLLFVKPENIFKSLIVYQNLINKIEEQVIYKMNSIKCEPMLSKYNLYPNKGVEYRENKNNLSELDMILWVLFLSDGENSVIQISKQLNQKKEKIFEIYKKLEKKKLVKRI